MGSEISDTILDRLIEECEGKGSEVKSEMISNISKHLANTRDPFAKRSLNYAFWNLITYMLKKKVSATKGAEPMNFTSDEVLAVNYGYVSDMIAKSSDKFSLDTIDEAFQLSTCINDVEIKFYSVTEWLNEQLKEFMGIYDIDKLRADYDAKSAKMQEYKKSNEDNFMQKKQVLGSIAKQMNNQALFMRIYGLTEKVNQCTSKYSLYKFKGNSGMALSKEERLELINIENEINTARNDRKELTKSFMMLNNDLCKCEDNVIDNEIELLGLVAGLAKAKADLESFIVSKNETSAAKKEEFINDRVTYIKNMAELVSKRNKIEPTPCLSEKVNARIPDIIIDALCEYLKADPRVFKTKKFKRFGYPSVIFVPGCGNGIYSYDYNAFIFPIFPATNYKESVVSAMVLYRWDCDEDREFREAYNSLKPYKKLSFVDLQRSLIKDFTIYITKELKGYKLFDKELRDWFAWQIAPKKDEIVDFEVLKHGESRRESKLADASRRSDDKAVEASLRAAEAAAKLSAAEKLMMEAELALNEAHETALKIAAEAARVSEEAANKSVEAARADISVKAEFMIKAAEASGKATEATIKAAEAARSENEAKINFEAKKADYERLKNEAEVSQRIAKNEEAKANEARASEDAKIASIKAGLGEMFKLAAAEENEARQAADKLKNEADQVKNDLQAKQSAAFKAEIAHRTAAEVMNSVNGLLKLSGRDLLKAKSYDELKNEAAAKVEAQAVAEAPSEEQQGFSESESADMRALFEEQLIALKDEIEKLKKENGELRKAGAGQGAQPNQHTASVSQQPGAEIPAGEKFAAVREFLYGKIKSIIKSDSVNEKLSITPSGKNKEAVNIHMTDVNAANGELDLILNTLAIQAKLQKFIEMIK